MNFRIDFADDEGRKFARRLAESARQAEQALRQEFSRLPPDLSEKFDDFIRVGQDTEHFHDHLAQFARTMTERGVPMNAIISHLHQLGVDLAATGIAPPFFLAAASGFARELLLPKNAPRLDQLVADTEASFPQSLDQVIADVEANFPQPEDKAADLPDPDKAQQRKPGASGRKRLRGLPEEQAILLSRSVEEMEVSLTQLYVHLYQQALEAATGGVDPHLFLAATSGFARELLMPTNQSALRKLAQQLRATPKQPSEPLAPAATNSSIQSKVSMLRELLQIAKFPKDKFTGAFVLPGYAEGRMRFQQLQEQIVKSSVGPTAQNPQSN